MKTPDPVIGAECWWFFIVPHGQLFVRSIIGMRRMAMKATLAACGHPADPATIVSPADAPVYNKPLIYYPLSVLM